MLKALRDTIRLTVDMAGMRGTFTKAELVDAFYAQHRDRLFGLQDQRERDLIYLTRCFTESMKEPLDGEVLDRLNVPRDFLHLLDKLPRTLCICLSGKHVLSILATADDWAANAHLKREVGQNVLAASKVSGDISKFLRDTGRESLLDFTRQAA